MAVIKRIDLERVGHRAVVLNLGDIAAQGERMKAAARAEAEEIRRAAAAARQSQFDDARAQGHSEGLKKGHAEGLKAGHAEGHAAALAAAKEKLKALESSWAAALDSFLTQRNTMLDAAKLDCLKLAVVAMEKITKRRLEVDPTLVAEQMAAAVAEAGKGTALVVRVGPEDLAFAQQTLPGIVRRLGGVSAEIREDAALSRGSCVVGMQGGGMVDATIETQMKRIAESLLPGAGERNASDPAKSDDAGGGA